MPMLSNIFADDGEPENAGTAAPVQDEPGTSDVTATADDDDGAGGGTASGDGGTTVVTTPDDWVDA